MCINFQFIFAQVMIFFKKTSICVSVYLLFYTICVYAYLLFYTVCVYVVVVILTATHEGLGGHHQHHLSISHACGISRHPHC